MGFGDNLKYYRELRGISQRELGNLLSHSVSEKTVSSWEVNRTEPSMGIVLEIASILNTTLDNLIMGKNNTESISFNDFDYALKNETKDLTDEQKQALLNMARVMKNTKPSK